MCTGSLSNEGEAPDEPMCKHRLSPESECIPPLTSTRTSVPVSFPVRVTLITAPTPATKGIRGMKMGKKKFSNTLTHNQMQAQAPFPPPKRIWPKKALKGITEFHTEVHQVWTLPIKLAWWPLFSPAKRRVNFIPASLLVKSRFNTYYRADKINVTIKNAQSSVCSLVSTK